MSDQRVTEGIDDHKLHGKQDPYVIESDADKAFHDAGKTSPKPKGIIAVDMDDVLCNTNGTIVDMHREMFKASPPITFDEFEHYLYWHNRGWGTQTETVEMVGQLYRAGLLERPTPLPGAKESLKALKAMGYALIVITARSEMQREGTEEWLAEHLPDLFDEIHFTGSFNHLVPTTKTEHEGHAAKRVTVSHKKRSKHEVMKQTGALFLIDDSAENALAAAKAAEPPRVLLFGDYPWNAEIVPPSGEGAADPEDQLIYIEAEKAGKLGARAARRRIRIERAWLPDTVTRVAGWSDVVDWVKDLEKGKVSL